MTALLPEVSHQHDYAHLAEVWEDRPGLAGFLTTVDHKRIAKRYFATAFTFLLLGGIEAMFLRAQLARPDNDLLGPERYNQLMTMHGTTMILLFNTPMFAAFGNYLIPLQIGARDMAFPRLNALSYWIFLLSGAFMYASFVSGSIPDGGWFAYAPLTENEFSAGHGLDFWAIGVTFLGISTTIGGINFIVTILRMRTPGMSLNRMPLFTWGILTMSVMIVFALPAVTLSGALLELDRAVGMHFFDASAGGDPLLYQHLFWIWGHPEVYIVFIPATGIVSMVIASMCRRPIIGYSLVVAALVATGFISFGLWVHHMFATGVPFLVASFFSAASLLVAIPSGMQIFAWLATMYDGGVRLETPMLFAIGFIVTFIMGGFTGVMVAVVPWDQAVTDSYFIVAHFHYVLIGGSVMPILAGIYFWYPKVTGYLTTKWLGKIGFLLIFVGFHLTFFVQHILGMLGMPRRVYTYHDGLGWNDLNLLSTIGAFVLAAGFAVVTVDIIASYRLRRPAPPNPWGAESLEWSTTSPPPVYNFAEFPVVQGASPLWDVPGDGSLVTIASVDDESLVDPPEPHHRTLLTSVLDAASIEVVTMPPPAYWPLLLGIGLLGLSTATLLRSWIIGVIAGAVTVYAFYRWHKGEH